MFGPKKIYLMAALDYYEYMKFPMTLFPEWIKKQYNLETHTRDGFVFLEIRRMVWGLPQAGILANKLLQKRLAPHGYYKCVNTPGLWRHATHLITFSLVVDNFGIKYMGKEHPDHLIKCLKEKIQTYQRLDRRLLMQHITQVELCGTDTIYFYAGVYQKAIVEIQARWQIQHCPYSLEPKRYGTDAQSPLPSDDTHKLTNSEIKKVQKIVRSNLYYARAVNMTVLMALSTIASEQTKGTKRTLEKAYQVLDYLATHPNATVKFRASDMIMNIHSDTSYLSERNACSRACGHFFMGSLPTDEKPIKLNGTFHTLCSIL